MLSTLQAEIDIAVKTNGKISSPVIRDKEWHRLPYLQAVIKEGLRIWPPVTGMMSKFSPPNGDEFDVNGKRVSIPGGTNIGGRVRESTGVRLYFERMRCCIGRRECWTREIRRNWKECVKLWI
jgi:hypothetical protein